MKTDRLELTSSCRFEVTRYEGIARKDVCLEYVEHSSDHWHSDRTTCVDLSEDDARKIIAFLTAAIGAQTAPQATDRQPLTP